MTATIPYRDFESYKAIPNKKETSYTDPQGVIHMLIPLKDSANNIFVICYSSRVAKELCIYKGDIRITLGA